MSKKQKERALCAALDIKQTVDDFTEQLAGFNLPNKHIVSNADHFFFGTYPQRVVTPIGDQPISGNVAGPVGRFLVVENGGRLYGQWLDHLFGYAVNIEKQVALFEHEPEQVSLF